jgi:hypothetical protein
MDIPHRKLAKRQAGMAVANAFCIRRQLRAYKKDTSARAARMVVLEGEDDPTTVWCKGDMKSS